MPGTDTASRIIHNSVDHGQKWNISPALPKYLRHFEGDNRADRPTAKQQRPFRLEGAQCIGIIRGNRMDRSSEIRSEFVSGHLDAIDYAIRSKHLGELSECSYVAPYGMNAIERRSRAVSGQRNNCAAPLGYQAKQGRFPGRDHRSHWHRFIAVPDRSTCPTITI